MHMHISGYLDSEVAGNCFCASATHYCHLNEGRPAGGYSREPEGVTSCLTASTASPSPLGGPKPPVCLVYWAGEKTRSIPSPDFRHDRRGRTHRRMGHGVVQMNKETGLPTSRRLKSQLQERQYMAPGYGEDIAEF